MLSRLPFGNLCKLYPYCVFSKMKLTTLRHIAHARKDQTVAVRVMLRRAWQAIGGLEENTLHRYDTVYNEDQSLHCKSIRWLNVFTYMCVLVFVHTWICIHSLPKVPYGRKKAPVLANKHFCIVDSSAMIPLVNLSAFDSKPLEAIISDKWKLYMKIKSSHLLGRK